ncbi:MAG: hypothetical protein EOO11_00700 [Chitinophagaceae bacterium]|nr:MAG: hypothetical protein EOO11_00700 [Chitinophagaceae bacterium]
MKQLRNNGLSIVFALLFLFSLTGQVLTGLHEHNEELKELGAPEVGLATYLGSGHFFESTFENWESEFLQMALFVVLTMWLYQKGSSESKDPDDPKDAVDRSPDPARKGAPWPVRRGGWVLGFYKSSLSYMLFLLFLLSFLLHWYGSLRDHNQEQALRGEPLESAWSYLGGTRFWFESFQNWQSEFLSVLVLVLFSIFLRQKGSPQSKPVDAPNDETGE